MANVRLFFGPILAGVLLGCILYGIVVSQSLYYFQVYRKRDGLWIRLFILYLLVVETIGTVIQIGVIFEPLILLYGTPQAVTQFPLLLPSGPMLTTLISTPIQLFTAWRIRVLTRSWIPAIILSVLSIAAFGSGIYASFETAVARVVSNKHKLNHPFFLILVAAADIFMAGCLVYILAKRKTSFASTKYTDLIINRIIRMTLQTGCITTAMALGDVISIFAAPGTGLNFAFDFSISKVYTNALLSTLNARSFTDGSTDGSTTLPLHFTSFLPPEADDENVLFGRELGSTPTPSSVQTSPLESKVVFAPTTELQQQSLAVLEESR